MAPTQLEIKVRALQRLLKEEQYYIQELKDQSLHVESLQKDTSVDPYDLKKQIEVLDDTKRLLPTLYQKIKEFTDDLEQYLKTYSGDDTIDAKETITKATELLKKQQN
ncbi:hypothetical protein KAFR_0A04050 [Kazachstania africana CBS 2517]|uniref:Tubulin-specific chaperone A n=1 Tax=Kazachstania africana (strain ATCC 22294 / BCRC 22015 / CBS 2517 / CECT 1963 / NBRC 1671 / NRRL Y-8276) TaxID=1071382 RepID=H2AN90_KAZAF|nr:hypothetical protein KAFR_0A04050 [Kazachstania africana CBS 2517]CCF55840.1 hypothetical protein KAFR_0A04050 [Kazachstania africana CBS 2517]